MKPASYILLLAIYYVCISASQGQTRVRPTRPTHRPGVKCTGPYRPFCMAAHAGGGLKRSDIDDVDQAIDIGDTRERPHMQEDREGERRGGGRGGGGRESDGFRGTIERDYFRSGSNRQLSDERQLVDIGNDHRRGHSPRSAQLDSAIGRLRSLLGTTDLDVDDRGEEEEEEKREDEEQDAPKQSLIGRDRNYVLNETQALLSKILSDIEGRLDPPPVPHSVTKN